MDKKQKSSEPRVEIFAEQPGTAPSTKNNKNTISTASEKVEAEAEAKVEEQKQEAKTDTLKKDDSSGEAG